MIYVKKYRYGIDILLYLCALGKFTLDYLRDSHKGQLLSINQVACIIVIIVTLAIRVYKLIRENKLDESTN